MVALSESYASAVEYMKELLPSGDVFRPDLEVMAGSPGRYVAATVNQDGYTWVWVLDAETEVITQAMVEPDSGVECFFDLEVDALNVCIETLNQKGTNDATKPRD